MIPAAFGVARAAVAALDSHLDQDALSTLTDTDFKAAWYAVGDLCRTADALHLKLRVALLAAAEAEVEAGVAGDPS